MDNFSILFEAKVAVGMFGELAILRISEKSAPGWQENNDSNFIACDIDGYGFYDWLTASKFETITKKGRGIYLVKGKICPFPDDDPEYLIESIDQLRDV